MQKEQQLITQEMRSLIGKEATPVTAWGEVTTSEIRRFIQAIPDEDPIYYDEAYAKNTRFGGVVAPPVLPQVMIGFRSPGTRDPLIDMPENRGGDAAESSEMEMARYPGLHEVIAHFPSNMRYFHGSDELEVYQLARLGDRITCQSKVVDMYEKPGRSGRLGFVVLELTYRNQRGELLCVCRHAEVLRETEKKG